MNLPRSTKNWLFDSNGLRKNNLSECVEGGVKWFLDQIKGM